MGNASMRAGKSAMAGITIGATAMACGDTGQGAGSVVATGAAIVLFGIGGRDAHAAHSTLGAGMAARAVGCHADCQ